MPGTHRQQVANRHRFQIRSGVGGKVFRKKRTLPCRPSPTDRLPSPARRRSRPRSWSANGSYGRAEADRATTAPPRDSMKLCSSKPACSISPRKARTAADDAPSASSIRRGRPSCADWAAATRPTVRHPTAARAMPPWADNTTLPFTKAPKRRLLIRSMIVMPLKRCWFSTGHRSLVKRSQYNHS